MENIQYIISAVTEVGGGFSPPPPENNHSQPSIKLFQRIVGILLLSAPEPFVPYPAHSL